MEEESTKRRQSSPRRAHGRGTGKRVAAGCRVRPQDHRKDGQRSSDAMEGGRGFSPSEEHHVPRRPSQRLVEKMVASGQAKDDSYALSTSIGAKEEREEKQKKQKRRSPGWVETAPSRGGALDRTCYYQSPDDRAAAAQNTTRSGTRDAASIPVDVQSNRKRIGRRSRDTIGKNIRTQEQIDLTSTMLSPTLQEPTSRNEIAARTHGAFHVPGIAIDQRSVSGVNASVRNRGESTTASDAEASRDSVSLEIVDAYVVDYDPLEQLVGNLQRQLQNLRNVPVADIVEGQQLGTEENGNQEKKDAERNVHGRTGICCWSRKGVIGTLLLLIFVAIVVAVAVPLIERRSEAPEAASEVPINVSIVEPTIGEPPTTQPSTDVGAAHNDSNKKCSIEELSSVQDKLIAEDGAEIDHLGFCVAADSNVTSSAMKRQGISSTIRPSPSTRSRVHLPCRLIPLRSLSNNASLQLTLPIASERCIAGRSSASLPSRRRPDTNRCGPKLHGT